MVPLSGSCRLALLLCEAAGEIGETGLISLGLISLMQ